MKKNKLEYLSAYLPYGLSLFNIENNRILKLVHGHNGYFSVEGVVGINFYSDSSCSFIENSHLKLILRPLSDLSKEIEINGKKIIPIVEIAKMAISDYEFEVITIDDNHYITCMDSYSIEFRTLGNNFKLIIKYDMTMILLNGSDEHTPFKQYQLFQKLIEFGLDIFGLIPEGLAIDINTLKKTT